METNPKINNEMNNALYEARRAPATIKKEGENEVLVRTTMIQHLNTICDEIDNSLSRIPDLLKKYGLGHLDAEAIQRDILRDGFAAIQAAVHSRTIAQLEKTGLFPKVRARLASENVEAIPAGLRDDLETLLAGIRGLKDELDLRLDSESLSFETGALRVPTQYRADIGPRYTLAVSKEDRDTLAEIRTAAGILADLNAKGLQIGDEFRIPPRGGSPILAPGLITRLARGSEYSDDELIGLLHGIALTH